MCDGTLCVCAVDFVAAVEETTLTAATKIVDNMCRSDRAVHVRKMAAKVFTRKIVPPGRTHPVWVLDHLQCTRLIMSNCLHGEKAEELGSRILEQFARHQGGDRTLIPEIIQQSESNSLAAQMARSAVGLPVDAATAVADTCETPEDRELKRRRLMAEVVHMELENSRLQQENSLKTLEACNMMISVRNSLSARCDLTALDRQLLTNLANYQLNAIAKGGSPDGPELTTVAKEAMFFGFPRDAETLRAVGRLASDAYFREHGQRPAKPIGSDPRYSECAYPSSARSLIHAAFAQHAEMKQQQQATAQRSITSFASAMSRAD
jgi:hypothetical protein